MILGLGRRQMNFCPVALWSRSHFYKTYELPCKKKICNTETCLNVSDMFQRTQTYSTEATEFLHIGKLLERQLEATRQYKNCGTDSTYTDCYKYKLKRQQKCRQYIDNIDLLYRQYQYQ